MRRGTVTVTFALLGSPLFLAACGRSGNGSPTTRPGGGGHWVAASGGRASEGESAGGSHFGGFGSHGGGHGGGE